MGCSQGCKALKKALAGMPCHGCDAASPAGHLGQDMIKRGFLSPLSPFSSWSNTPESRVVRRERWGAQASVSHLNNWYPSNLQHCRLLAHTLLLKFRFTTQVGQHAAYCDASRTGQLGITKIGQGGDMFGDAFVCMD